MGAPVRAVIDIRTRIDDSRAINHRGIHDRGPIVSDRRSVDDRRRRINVRVPIAPVVRIPDGEARHPDRNGEIVTG